MSRGRRVRPAHSQRLTPADRPWGATDWLRGALDAPFLPELKEDSHPKLHVLIYANTRVALKRSYSLTLTPLPTDHATLSVTVSVTRAPLADPTTEDTDPVLAKTSFPTVPVPVTHTLLTRDTCTRVTWRR